MADKTPTDAGVQPRPPALERVRALLDVHELDAIVLSRRSSFAWVTGGGSSGIDLGTDLGVASVVVGREGAWVATSPIESDRLAEEEIQVEGLEVVTTPWAEGGLPDLDVLRGRVGTDAPAAGDPGWVNLQEEVRRERMLLDDSELERYRALGPEAAEAVEEVCAELRPGTTEVELAAEVARAALRRRIQPVVLLVGADERLARHRHPLPTSNRIEREVMVVICGERGGLFANLTRFVRFAEPDDAALRRHATVARVLDAAIAATVPGRTYGEVFADITEAYAAAGHPGEWTRHHQGGVTGYASRELIATPGEQEPVSLGHAVTWNPSVPSAKCEDTVLITPAGPELVTQTPSWPRKPAEGSTTGLALPGVLQR